MNKEQMKLTKFDQHDNIATCHICHAPNHKPTLPNPLSDKVVDHLYKLKFGQSVVVLCEDCLKQFSTLIDSTLPLPTQPAPPSNNPLTIEELKRMYDRDETQIWVTFGVATLPAILDYYNGELVAVWCADAESMLHEKKYGTTWLAYASKPTLD